MFSAFYKWRHSRVIGKSAILPHVWLQAIERLPILSRLSMREREKLIELATLFIHYKTFEGAKGLVVTREMELLIALQACLPILNLGIAWYDGWYSVIVYPSAFVPRRTVVDENGVHHESSAVLSGESWHKGPVVLAWDEVEQAGIIDGDNLVIHEFAHKLDLRSGHVNGFPDLHRNMSRQQWTSDMQAAFSDFHQRLSRRQKLGINPYAAESPAEFFAVLSEVFFERPDILNQYYPEIYQLFSQFYRQQPL